MRALLFLSWWALGSGLAGAENWPGWRGPGGQGVVPGREGPASFSEERMWKTELGGRACSTPVVWKGSVFVTGLAGDRDSVQAFELKTGRELWRKEIGPARLGRTQRIGSSANSSPLTDGKNLFVYFKSGTVASLTLEGEVVWKINLDEISFPDKILWDRGTSPVFAGGRLVIAVMQQAGKSFLIGLNKDTGRKEWLTERAFKTVGENGDSYSSPFVATVDGVETIVTWGGDHLTGHDAKSGKQIWYCGGFNPRPHPVWRTIASPAQTDGVAIVPYGREEHIAGIRLGGKGDVTRTAWLWKEKGWGSDTATPAASRKRALMLTDTGKERGTLTFVDIMSGRKLWQAKLPKSVHTFCASPVVTGDQLYLVRRDGTVFTARLGKEGISGLEEISLGEGVIATPAVVEGRVLIRGDRHLVCLW
ncbi:MAG: Pyrrolo-quinoline quinone [Roseibacillus sp.]|nr:Pyrrolo-quinoline quinone [Roseibacillus sp.]